MISAYRPFIRNDVSTERSWLFQVVHQGVLQSIAGGCCFAGSLPLNVAPATLCSGPGQWEHGHSHVSPLLVHTDWGIIRSEESLSAEALRAT